MEGAEYYQTRRIGKLQRAGSCSACIVGGGREQVRGVEVEVGHIAYARLKLLHPSLPNGTDTSFTT